MSESDVQFRDLTNWRLAAAGYRARLHTVCLLAALCLYGAAGWGVSKMLERWIADSAMIQTVALISWVPLGFAAWYLKGLLEDWADSGLPRP